MCHNSLQLCVVRCFNICLVVTGVAGTFGFAQVSEAQVVAIEEDWELVLIDPDADTVAPQVTCVMSPTGDTNSFHVAFELNHQTQPDFRAGGLQVQFWDGENPLSSRRFPNETKLATAGETVRWTQRLTLYGNNIGFEVRNGTSTTWGAFGGEGYLKDVRETSLSSLTGYSPTVSVDNSGVGYAGNRVARLVLKEVRYYTIHGLVARDTTDRIAHESQ